MRIHLTEPNQLAFDAQLLMLYYTPFRCTTFLVQSVLYRTLTFCRAQVDQFMQNDCLLRTCNYGVFWNIATKGVVISSEWDLMQALSVKSDIISQY